MTNPIVRTMVTYAMYKDYYSYNFKKRKSFILLIVLAVIAILYTAYVIIATLNKGDPLTFENMLPFIILFLVYIAYFIIYKVQLKTSYNKMRQTFMTPLLYEFYNNEMQIRVEGQAGEAVKVPYSAIKLVLERPNCWYLVQGSGQSYIVGKEIVKGSLKDIMITLRKIVGTNYKKVK